MTEYLVLSLLAVLVALVGVLVTRESGLRWGPSLLTALGLFLAAVSAFARLL